MPDGKIRYWLASQDFAGVRLVPETLLIDLGGAFHARVATCVWEPLSETSTITCHPINMSMHAEAEATVVHLRSKLWTISEPTANV